MCCFTVQGAQVCVCVCGVWLHQDFSTKQQLTGRAACKLIASTWRHQRANVSYTASLSTPCTSDKAACWGPIRHESRTPHMLLSNRAADAQCHHAALPNPPASRMCRRWLRFGCVNRFSTESAPAVADTSPRHRSSPASTRQWHPHTHTQARHATDTTLLIRKQSPHTSSHLTRPRTRILHLLHLYHTAQHTSTHQSISTLS